MLFLIDGLSELVNIKRINVVCRKINKLIEILPHCKFIVTCRSGDYRDEWLPDFQRWDIMALEEGTQKEYLKRLTNDIELIKRVNFVLDADQKARGICSNQFLFLLAVQLIYGSGSPFRLA
jgi:hypothetical protein